jgi:hypothetical protein
MYTDRHLWKLNSDEHFTPEVVRGVYRNLVDAGVIPSPENDFLFVSPTANVPTHETTLFNQDQKTRTGKATFLVGDMCPTPLCPESISKKTDTGSFQYFRWDAETLPIKPGVADMIWDRKGWLWHAARDLSPERFILALHRYYEILKTGGSLVIDHADRAATKANLEFEASTVRVIRECQIPRSPDLEDTARIMFEVKVVGTGLGRVNVMRKRTDEESARVARSLTK